MIRRPFKFCGKIKAQLNRSQPTPRFHLLVLRHHLYPDKLSRWKMIQSLAWVWNLCSRHPRPDQISVLKQHRMDRCARRHPLAQRRSDCVHTSLRCKHHVSQIVSKWWSARSDHILIRFLTCLHLAVTHMVLNDLSGYRWGFITRCDRAMGHTQTCIYASLPPQFSLLLIIFSLTKFLPSVQFSTLSALSLCLITPIKNGRLKKKNPTKHRNE